MKHYKFKKSFRFEGKRYYAYGKTEAEAIRNMARKRLELEQGLVTYDSHMLVKDWAKEALQTYKADLSGRAYYDTVKRIEKHILPELGDLQIGKVKPIHCQRLINSKTGYSKEYIEKISQNLKFIFTKAKENGMIRENPAEYIVKPKGHKNPRRSLTDHEENTSSRSARTIASCLSCLCFVADAGRPRPWGLNTGTSQRKTKSLSSTSGEQRRTTPTGQFRSRQIWPEGSRKERILLLLFS